MQRFTLMLLMFIFTGGCVHAGCDSIPGKLTGR